MLGEPYKEGVRRRMADRQERRIQFSGIDLSITERFGSLCSPFQALHVQVGYAEQARATYENVSLTPRPSHPSICRL